MRFEAAARSDQGLVRPNNEDSYFSGPTLLAVSDGVGGRPAGDIASRLAVSCLTHGIAAGLGAVEAFRLASAVVTEAGRSSSLLTGMCATLTAASISGERVTISHIGDTRAWLVRDGSATRLTEDQTITAQLLAAGEITEAEAAEHPKRHTLFQCVGTRTGDDLVVAIHELEAQVGDRLVLASDGLAYAGPAELVEKLMAAPGTAQSVVESLVDAALTAGGQDNVTVIVADLAD